MVERNRPDDTFGWGVVLSDETLANLKAADPESAAAIERGFVYWDDIAVVLSRHVARSSGHGFCGIGRKRLLNILQDRARELGVELRFETEIESLEPYRGYDLIVAADGVNSKVRRPVGARVQARHRHAACQVRLARHARRSSTTPSPSSSRRPSTAGSGRTPTSSTPTPRPSSSSAREATWDDFGFDTMSQEETIASCERIFAKHLGGHPLMTNAAHLRGSAWLNFPRVLCEHLVATRTSC